MNEIINVRVNGNTLTKDYGTAGVQGEANSTKLRITFDDNWDGFAKTITFWNALGENPVNIVLGTNLLEDILVSTRVYIVPIPGEAMTEAGENTFVVRGYMDGVIKRTIEGKLKVPASMQADEADAPMDVTPTQAEQLQVEIDAMTQDLIDVKVLGKDMQSKYKDIVTLDSRIKRVDEDVRKHLMDRENPHNVTARQLGIAPGANTGTTTTSGFCVEANDDLASIIPANGEQVLIRYANMPAYDENKELIITDTVRYRIFVGDGITPLSELLPITNLQSGEGTGSVVQIDPTYDKGDDRYYSPNEAPGQLSAAFGKYNKVPGRVSMACGYDNLIEADRAFAAGASNCIGKDAKSAFVAGLYNIVNALQQQAFGKFNNPDDPDALFMIGAGTGVNNRKNAFTVCKDGTIKFNEKAFDFLGNEYAVELAGEFRQLVDQLNLPASLGVDVDGKLICNPVDGTITENILKFRSGKGHSDVTANGTLDTYSEYPANGDRIWAFLGTVASLSSSNGTFTSIKAAHSTIPTHGNDEWAAFKIKIPKSGKYVLHETWGFYKNGGAIESYIIPMTDEVRTEFAPDNIETYGNTVNAGNESLPNTMTRENFKYFSDLTSVQGAKPIGAIDTLIPNQSSIVYKTERIGTVELSEGEYVLILRVISTKKWAMTFSDFTLSTFEPLTDRIKVGETTLTENDLSDMLGHRKEIDDIKALFGSFVTRENMYKVGDTLSTLRTDLGDNWLMCDGSTIPSKDYPELCALDSLQYPEVSIGSSHGSTKIYCYNHVWLTASTYANSKTLVSTDPADTWTELSQGLGFVDIAYYNGTYVGLTPDGKVYSTKTPTDTWTLVHNLASDLGSGHVYRAICCYNGTYAVLTTTTGSTAMGYYISKATTLSGTWQTTTVGTGDVASLGKETMCCYEGTWVISCAMNYIFVATDPLGTWTQKEVRKDSNTNTIHYDIACHEGTWVIAGNYCCSTKNPLGDWEYTSVPGLTDISTVQHNGDRWVIAGRANTIYPALWTSENPTGAWKYTILGSAGCYVNDVAFDGEIMTALNSNCNIYTTGIKKLPDNPLPNSTIFTYIKAK